MVCITHRGNSPVIYQIAMAKKKQLHPREARALPRSKRQGRRWHRTPKHYPMDSPDQRAAVSKIVAILRRATRLVKVVPFLYLVVFALYMLLCPFVPDEVLCAIDSVFVVSPAVSGLFLILSRVFRLCRWHSAACAIPTSSSIEGFIDNYVITLTSSEVVAINLILGVGTIVFIILANTHIYGRKAIPARNS